MACLIPVILALLAWADMATLRMLLRRQANPAWWATLWIVGGLGLAFGVWIGAFLEYQPSPRLRVFGAPFAAAILHLEGPPGEEHWVDYITPVPFLIVGSNVLLVALLAPCPVGILFWLSQRSARPTV